MNLYHELFKEDSGKKLSKEDILLEEEIYFKFVKIDLFPEEEVTYSVFTIGLNDKITTLNGIYYYIKPVPCLLVYNKDFLLVDKELLIINKKGILENLFNPLFSFLRNEIGEFCYRIEYINLSNSIQKIQNFGDMLKVDTLNDFDQKITIYNKKINNYPINNFFDYNYGMIDKIEISSFSPGNRFIWGLSKNGILLTKSKNTFHSMKKILDNLYELKKNMKGKRQSSLNDFLRRDSFEEE